MITITQWSKHKNGKNVRRTLRDAENAGCDLAFFSVVASSPNLSTFITPQKYANYFE